MANYEEGQRVLAIRDGGEIVLNVFGEGEYVGDKMRPGSEWPSAVSDDDYDAMAAVVTEHHDVPIEEHPWLSFYDVAVEMAGPDNPPSKTREEIMAELEAERKRPVEDRVRELWEATNKNPCIHLDSGDIVWGFQCWWGPLDSANARYPETRIPRIVVPVPEGNGRWK
jgi:hypothetical protein